MSGGSGSVVDGWYRTIALSTLPCYEDAVTETFDCFLPVLLPFPFHFLFVDTCSRGMCVAVKGRLCCGDDGRMVDTCHVLFYLARRAGENV